MSAVWVPAYIAIGSNLDDPVRQVRDAVQRLASIERSGLIALSRLYRSAPLGPQDQPEFVNAAAGLLTQLSPRQLLDALQGIEQQMGRAPPAVRWGARRIDLDLLIFGAEKISEPGLMVPHPGVPDRNFVLYPLLDIAPTLNVPGQGPVAALARRVSTAGLIPIE